LATPEERYNSGFWFQIFLVNKTWTIENEKVPNTALAEIYWTFYSLKAQYIIVPYH
jgi:hypothetical protein